ncbi:iron-containing alcohol dehydrogenase [Amaricoccus sp.]|uniref:iron-containing alcohol dehydrogenase n=1 Tax=Amaricoccus sp. TaxID=1872485 RepID=UPI001B7510C4|nr:iron-containing alcohol dehydrogenase [Amaricoccus sp.]MBP7002942.1 iron-containing alcohol dehydrogenase [Amaricoccus sp.]
MALGGKIDALLRGTYVDRETGERIGVATRSLAIERSLDGMEAELVRGLGFGRRVAVVSDPTTHEVLGARVERAIAGAHEVRSVVLEAGVHPDDAAVARVRAATAGDDALIAVGSGTINDIGKYASALDGKPYAVFATAPSMNGFVSLNAAITVHGHKLSLPAQAPAGAFFDLRVLGAAPARLLRAGLGDSLCRTTAQADWLMAHLLLDTPYRALPFDLLAEDEGPLFDGAAALMRGDPEIVERLVSTLLLAGFGTAIVGNSQPASQGEHLVSHFIDMFADHDRPLVFHGEQVGVTTLSVARLQERMLEERPRFKADAATEAEFVGRYGAELGASCWAAYRQKRLDAGRAEALNARAAERWDDIREKVAAVLLPSRHLESVLRAAGADVAPEAIHLTRGFYERALLRAREIRERYTCLDLAGDTGRLSGLAGAL